jgi:hypothetical protein
MRKLLKNIFSYRLWFGEVPKDLSVLDKRDEKLFKPAPTWTSIRTQKRSSSQNRHPSISLPLFPWALRYGTRVSLRNRMKISFYITEIYHRCLQKYLENKSCKIEEISRSGIKKPCRFHNCSMRYPFPLRSSMTPWFPTR